MNPSRGRVADTPLEVLLGDGRGYPARLWRAAAPRGIAAIVHGLCEHGGRYAAFASDLADAGWTSAAVDWPGHGRSPGPRGHADWTAVRDDVVPALAAALREASPPGLPLVVFGHSMGGVMALDYALAHPAGIDSVVVTSPGLRGAPPPAWKHVVARVLMLVAPRLGLPHGLPLDGISRDAEVLERYLSDPLMHGVISPALYFGLIGAQARVLSSASRLSIPALVLAGTGDAIVDWTGARDFVAGAPPSLARFVPCEGAYHEILNDSGREVVVRTIVDWLDGRLAEQRRSADQAP